MKITMLAALLLIVAGGDALARTRVPCDMWQARSSVTGRYVSIMDAQTNPRETSIYCIRHVPGSMGMYRAHRVR